MARRARPEATAGGRPPLAGVRIARLRRQHLRAVLRIERAVYPRPWSESLFASEIRRRGDRRYLVALADGPRLSSDVLGYAGLLLQADEAHVSTVAVHPAHHRRMIATRLLIALMREAVLLGAEAATLEVRTGNLGAQRLYQAFGFAPVGVRPGYYVETGEDALIMWVHDVQGAAYAAVLARQEARLAERLERGR